MARQAPWLNKKRRLEPDNNAGEATVPPTSEAASAAAAAATASAPAAPPAKKKQKVQTFRLDQAAAAPAAAGVQGPPQAAGAEAGAEAGAGTGTGSVARSVAAAAATATATTSALPVEQPKPKKMSKTKKKKKQKAERARAATEAAVAAAVAAALAAAAVAPKPKPASKAAASKKKSAPAAPLIPPPQPELLPPPPTAAISAPPLASSIEARDLASENSTMEPNATTMNTTTALTTKTLVAFENTNADASENANVDPLAKEKARLLLCEKIDLLEHTIETIYQRQSDCDTALEAAQAQEVHWTDQVATEQQQCLLLQVQMANQQALLQRLQQSMSQTHAAYIKFGGEAQRSNKLDPADSSRNEMVKRYDEIQSATSDDGMDEDDEEWLPRGGSLDTGLVDSDAQASTHESTAAEALETLERGEGAAMDVVGVDNEQHATSETENTGTVLPSSLQKSFFPAEDDFVELSFPPDSSMDVFWNAKRRPASSNQSAFLCSVTSEASLKTIMEMTTRETLHLDILDPTGRHRAEAMRYTSLDFDMLSTSATSAALSRPGTIDRREGNANSSSSGSEIAMVDPSIALCPFELSGICADLDCPYQHLGQRPTGSKILPRELLPLPTLCLGDDYHVGGTSQSKKQLQRDKESKRKEESNSNSVVDDKAKPKHDIEINSSPVLSSDFVVLPPPDPNDDLSDGDIAENPQPPKYRTQDDQSLDFWWIKDGSDRSPFNKSSPVSISEMLLSLGVQLVAAPNEMTRLQLRHCFNASLLDGCRYAAMLLDCTRLAVHSGRFDVAYSLHKLAGQTYEQHLCNANHTSMDEAFCQIYSNACLSVMEASVQNAFAFESKENETAFRVAFASQANLALASLFFQQLFSLIEKRSEADGDWSYWIATSSLVLESYQTPASPNDEQDTFSALFSLASDGDEAEDPLNLLDALMKSAQKATSRRSSISLETTARVLVDESLYPSFNTVRSVLGSEIKEHVMSKAVLLFSGIVLDVLETSASLLSLGSVLADFEEVNDVVDKVLYEVRSMLPASLTKDYVFAPVFASNVALAVRLQRYRTANNRLVNVLGALCIEKHGLLPHSELVWSQLVQLRMSLPLRTIYSEEDSYATKINRMLTSTSNASNDNAVLAKLMSTLGVFPHHIGLANDWNLVRILQSSGILAAKDDGQKEALDGGKPMSFLADCRALHQNLIGQSAADLSFCFGMEELRTRDGYETSRTIKSAIPYSLLLGGSFIVDLNLSGTGLQHLPLHFGLYFPRLQLLDLTLNDLEELPPTMEDMVALEKLYLSNNKIASLPDSFIFPNLTLLYAQNNRLTTLPQAVASCTKLQSLNVLGNPLGPAFWRVVARLQLLELQPQMQT